MKRIAIVDDEKQERETLKGYYQKLQAEIAEEFEMHLFSSGDELLSGNDCVYDIICLDIDMEGRDGISTAKEIRKQNESVLIIFITNMAQMAIRGYEVQALDFVLKPVNYFSFAMKMRNAVSIVNNKKSRNIVVNTVDGLYRLSTNDLLYAEINGHYLYYHTVSGEMYKQKASLTELEQKLDGLSFKRCNNCYLVNLKYVDSVNREGIKIGEAWLKISRPRKKEFLQALANYMGGIRI